MSIDRALFNGLSGLNSFSTAISVVSDNIANANTTGFKSSSALFGDMVSNEIALASDQKQNQGSGSSILGIATNYGEGTLEGTSTWSDLAVSGEGFFMVNPVTSNSATGSTGSTGTTSTPTYYTRDGSFHLDGDGYLVNLQGDRVQGYAYSWKTDATSPSVAGQTTFTKDSTDVVTGSGGSFTLSQPSYVTLAVKDNKDNTVGTSYLGYMSAGKHDIDWSDFNSQDNTDSAGATFTPTLQADVLNPPDSASQPQAIQIPEQGAAGTLDHNWPASYVKYYVTTDGTLHGVGQDGKDYSLAKVALTKFSNDDGLERTGNNLYTEGPEIGAKYNNLNNPEMFGQIQDSTLEGSNVDIAKQMVDLIRYQSSYNANSKTITTSNQMLNTSINMVQ